MPAILLHRLRRPVYDIHSSINVRRNSMKGKEAVERDDLRNEKRCVSGRIAESDKQYHPSRKPAHYRSVGIRVPGNDSLMVVHVREY